VERCAEHRARLGDQKCKLRGTLCHKIVLLDRRRLRLAWYWYYYITCKISHALAPQLASWHSEISQSDLMPMYSELHNTGGSVMARMCCCTVLGCEQKSVEVEFRWLNLRVCNANYAAEQAIDAKFWWRKKVCRTLGVVAGAHRVLWVVEKALGPIRGTSTDLPLIPGTVLVSGQLDIVATAIKRISTKSHESLATMG